MVKSTWFEGLTVGCLGAIALAMSGCVAAHSTPGAPEGGPGTVPGDASSSTDGGPPFNDAMGEEDVSSPSWPTDAAYILPMDGAAYRHAGNMCCAYGQGLSCCTADAGLLGYGTGPDGAAMTFGGLEDGGKEANCFEYGGYEGTCIGSNQLFDGKDPCWICCEGFTRAIPLVPNDAGPGCVTTEPGSALICIPCGNGKCDPDENHCTCPSDCP